MPAPIHSNRFASDEVAIDQCEHDLRNLGFTAPVAERRRALRGANLFVSRTFGRHVRSRSDGVHQDLIGCQLEGQALGERDNSGFRDVVRQKSCVSRPATSRRPIREVDDAATSQTTHVGRGRARTQERGSEVSFERRVPVSDRQLIERFRSIHRRHVDEDIQTAERVHGSIDNPFARVRLAKVTLNNECPAGQAADRDGVAHGFTARVAIDEGNVGSSSRQFGGNNGPDPFPTRDQRDSPVQLHMGVNGSRGVATRKRFSAAVSRIGIGRG